MNRAPVDHGADRPLPPPGAADAPWFVYRRGPGKLRGSPYAWRGWAAFVALLTLPAMIPLVLVVWVPTVSRLLIAGLSLLVLAATLAAIFRLMVRRGRRIE